MTNQGNWEDPGSLVNNDCLPAYIGNRRAERLWDWVANRYAAKPVTDEDAYSHKMKITRQYLHHKANVLELGCGTGSTALEHAKYVNHIMALDVSSRMIKIARSKAAAARVENIDFLHRDVDYLQLTVDDLDVVLMLNVLHLLAGWRRHITASYRALRPGSVFVSSNLCMSDGFTFIRFQVLLGRIAGLLPHLSFFTQNDLERAQVDAGFDIEYRYVPGGKTAVFYLARKPC